jgi:hypothetical protein
MLGFIEGDVLRVAGDTVPAGAPGGGGGGGGGARDHQDGEVNELPVALPGDGQGTLLTLLASSLTCSERHSRADLPLAGPLLCLVTGWPLLKCPHVAVGVTEK